MWECACGGMVTPYTTLGTRSKGRCKKCGAESTHNSSIPSEYTTEEQQRVDELIQNAVDAEELYGADECEAFAERQRERWGHD